MSLSNRTSSNSTSETWTETAHPARLEEILGEGTVRCHLSPRNCVIKEGKFGFCGVRGNRDGRLISLNYGKSVHATEETIETEAVNHYSPGERILSMGNIGCMLHCSYCHNWKTSQARFVSDKDVYYYSPEDVVDIAQRHGIGCISWTYNDPVVWHEFILDTARLARQAGMINLYKSAFFISPEAVEELCPFMDIFSISIKSMDPHYYKKMTGGWLEPVLEATKQVYKAGKHVELSTLMVTDISDNEKTAHDVASWVLSELNSTIPLHYVRFHPDYKMRNTICTPIPRLLRAREIAIEMGVSHVYLGNVYDTHFSNTFCSGCGEVLVTRYGLNARIIGLDERGHCKSCGRDAHFKLRPAASGTGAAKVFAPEGQTRNFDWHGDVRSLHVQVRNESERDQELHYRRRYRAGAEDTWKVIPLKPGESYRFIIAKSREDEIGPEIAQPDGISSNLHEVFDRAHFPTVSVEMGRAETDISPLPYFPGKQRHITPAGS